MAGLFKSRTPTPQVAEATRMPDRESPRAKAEGRKRVAERRRRAKGRESTILSRELGGKLGASA